MHHSPVVCSKHRSGKVYAVHAIIVLFLINCVVTGEEGIEGGKGENSEKLQDVSYMGLPVPC